MTVFDPIENPVDALRKNVSAPFDQARAMPPSVYYTDEFLAEEIEHIFKKDWFCVGRASSLAEVGDYVTCELADQPIIVLRDKDGELRAYSNVCRHRMSTLLHGRGKTKSIVCPYHAWTYNLDGSLRGAPAMNGNKGFCKDDYALPSIACQEWLGWVFITLNPDAEPVAEQLSEVEELVKGYDMTNYTETFFEEHLWDTNWKVLAENFMESYHLPVCHAGTIGGLSRLDEMICPPGRKAFNYHTILKDETLRIAMAHPSNDRLQGDERRTTFLLAIYPSLLITLTPGYFWYLSLHPKGPSQVQIRFGGGMSDDYADDAEAQQNLTELKTLLDEVNVEDRGCTEKVYRGLCADGAEPGHLSHLERPNFDFAQYLMSRVDPSFEPKIANSDAKEGA
ncbi:aromatic ring-hydroxylating oxygenase subunit alpha [Falsiruegeria mediterranea]|jgi:phenylpropionate dioxygenase-like ring-hydroxylating dioxygenase large terminal subunit|uniref:2-aminobenzenesulfonate 2,3-dioxygenase subunit alpha n=1 Tax=Falsiruegeria mediterranea M17 TaxID=1200281 RepID=A0A2R8CDN8_9RHOB|nr:Rieske 2Fe-2S domain-containing protein [Falsiruegeria mediterranea]SPJ30555.1 2-aminobenzenesulfonate 2,3-dioxygenase subunit alpha [Falsiruegeria mediterranea M17]